MSRKIRHLSGFPEVEVEHLGDGNKRMKLSKLVFFFLAGMPVYASAYGAYDCVKDVTQEDNGIGNELVTRLCSSASSSAVKQCYFQSFSFDTGIGRGLAIDLCNGAESSQPLNCYKSIFTRDKDIGRGLAVSLCNGASSSEPLSCYVKIFSTDSGIGRGLAINLCTASRNASKTIDCYVKAAAGGMNRKFATDLCQDKKPSKGLR